MMLVDFVVLIGELLNVTIDLDFCKASNDVMDWSLTPVYGKE